jgi:hypothetical protein
VFSIPLFKGPARRAVAFLCVFSGTGNILGFQHFCPQTNEGMLPTLCWSLGTKECPLALPPFTYPKFDLMIPKGYLVRTWWVSIECDKKKIMQNKGNGFYVG